MGSIDISNKKHFKVVVDTLEKFISDIKNEPIDILNEKEQEDLSKLKRIHELLSIDIVSSLKDNNKKNTISLIGRCLEIGKKLNLKNHPSTESTPKSKTSRLDVLSPAGNTKDASSVITKKLNEHSVTYLKGTLEHLSIGKKDVLLPIKEELKDMPFEDKKEFLISKMFKLNIAQEAIDYLSQCDPSGDYDIETDPVYQKIQNDVKNLNSYNASMYEKNQAQEAGMQSGYR